MKWNENIDDVTVTDEIYQMFEYAGYLFITA